MNNKKNEIEEESCVLEEIEISKSDVKLTAQDWGWVTVNIGMGIGAGIVFLPIQAGIVGLWVFLLSVIVAYPALFLFQRLFINTLVVARACEDYPTVISEFLGKKWGILLGFLYFIMLTIWLFVYTQTITNDSASYLFSYGVTNVLLSKYSIYGLFIILFMVFLAFKSRVLLFKISKILVFVILSILVVLGIMMVPHWDTTNIAPLVSTSVTVKNIIITLPFAMTSILFLQSLSPMVVALRADNDNIEIARIKSHKIMNRSFFLLGGIVFFFALSSTLAINRVEAQQAFVKNISFMAIVGEHFPSKIIPILSIALSIFAVMTSFFGVLLAFHEACMGLAINIFIRKVPRNMFNTDMLSKIIIVFIVFLSWSSILLNLPIMWFTSICSPIFGIIGCFIPIILVYKTDKLEQYRKGPLTFAIVLTGILLCASPFLAFI